MVTRGGPACPEPSACLILPRVKKEYSIVVCKASGSSGGSSSSSSSSSRNVGKAVSKVMILTNLEGA